MWISVMEFNMERKDLFRALPFAEQHTETMGDVSYWRHNELKLPSPILWAFLKRIFHCRIKIPFCVPSITPIGVVTMHFYLVTALWNFAKTLRIGIKRIVWLSQMKQSVYHSVLNLLFSFCARIQKLFLLVTAILFNSLMQYGATI